MFGVEALPLLYSFSQSERAADRALFVRVYGGLIGDCRRRGETPPADWTEALAACLARAHAPERELYLAELAAVANPSAVAAAETSNIEAIVVRGSLESRIALARDRRATLKPEQMQILVAQAREAHAHGDRRLVDALLAREPLRLEAAPLFLQASPEQRWALLLAAQRAELGRRAAPLAPFLDAAAADRLEFAAIAGGERDFAAALAQALDAEVEVAARIAADPGGEAMVAALIALGAPRDTCVRILTARDIQDGRGYPRIQALARLSHQLSASAARRIIAALIDPAPEGVAAPARAAPSRNVAAPSPFLRREAQRTPSAVQPKNDRNVGAK